VVVGYHENLGSQKMKISLEGAVVCGKILNEKSTMVKYIVIYVYG